MPIYETNKALGRCIRDTFELDPTDTFAILIFKTRFVFNGNYYKCFVLCATATFARPFATYIGLQFRTTCRDLVEP